MTSTTGQRNRGFTLLELVLVLAILSIALGLAVPSLHGFAQGRRAGECAEQIVSLTQWAHTQSITRGLTYRLNLDPAARTYWLTVENDDGTVSAPREEFGRVFSAPEGVTLNWSAPTQPDGTYIHFLSTGRTDPATITVTDLTGHATQITCDSATELFHIVSDQERRL